MNKQSLYSLREELLSTGASKLEAAGLLLVAARLQKLKTASESMAEKPTSVVRKRWLFIIPSSLTALTGLVLGMVLVIFSQTVLPGSWLYPMQNFSDSVIVMMHPGYRATIMMHQAHMVKMLVSRKAPSSLVVATLNAYQREYAAYGLGYKDYEAFEYCRATMQQAAAMTSSDSERHAITAALNTLPNA